MESVILWYTLFQSDVHKATMIMARTAASTSVCVNESINDCGLRSLLRGTTNSQEEASFR